MSFLIPASDFSELHEVARRGVGTNFQMCCLVRRDRPGWIAFSKLNSLRWNPWRMRQVCAYSSSAGQLRAQKELDHHIQEEIRVKLMAAILSEHHLRLATIVFLIDTVALPWQLEFT